jgi:hypothetical protein
VSTGITIHKAWTVNTSLFEQLVVADSMLVEKSAPWKHMLADSVVATHRKLTEYYSNTISAQGKIYNWATVLDPT